VFVKGSGGFGQRDSKPRESIVFLGGMPLLESLVWFHQGNVRESFFRLKGSQSNGGE